MISTQSDAALAFFSKSMLGAESAAVAVAVAVAVTTAVQASADKNK